MVKFYFLAIAGVLLINASDAQVKTFTIKGQIADSAAKTAVF
jgi:hypothetical protein